MRPRLGAAVLTLLLGLGVSATATAQQPPVRTIGPGMTTDEVRQAMGPAIYERSYGDFTYWFYDNGCEETCGFLDLVIFQNGQVVDAVFRAPWHQYTGESSSPRGAVPRPTPGGERLQVPEGRVEGVEVRPAQDSVPPETGS